MFLGMGVDIPSKSLFIPVEKKIRYLKHLELVNEDKRVWNLKLFRSLVGKLSFCSALVPVGRCRMFNMFQCLKGALNAGQPVVFLTSAAVSDMVWWKHVLTSPPILKPVMPWAVSSFNNTVVTDASGVGLGAHWNGEYFSYYLTERGRKCHSTLLELLVLEVACLIWGHRWKNRRIFWKTDCEPHVQGLVKIRSGGGHLEQLHFRLDTLMWEQNFLIDPIHIPRELNMLADSLSRGEISGVSFETFIKIFFLKSTILLSSDLFMFPLTHYWSYLSPSRFTLPLPCFPFPLFFKVPPSFSPV